MGSIVPGPDAGTAQFPPIKHDFPSLILWEITVVSALTPEPLLCSQRTETVHLAHMQMHT